MKIKTIFAACTEKLCKKTSHNLSTRFTSQKNSNWLCKNILIKKINKNFIRNFTKIKKEAFWELKEEGAKLIVALTHMEEVIVNNLLIKNYYSIK